MNRRDFLKCAGVGAFVAALPGWRRAEGSGNTGATPSAVKGPNIIVILTDDLGYGDVGCYGASSQHIRTPNIDRLAREGVRFTDGHSPSSVCTPSRYALMTGEYAFRNNKGRDILSGEAPLSIRPGTYTLPLLFQKQGYTTGFVGKWHLGLGDGGDSIQWNGDIRPGPLEIGFDEAFYYPATNDRVPTVYIRNHSIVNLDPSDPIRISYGRPVGNEPTGRDHLESATVLRGLQGRGHLDAITEGVSRIGFMTGGRTALWKDGEMADTLAGEAVKFIDKHKDKPFFLYFATHGIHEPRVPGKRFDGRSGCGTYGDQVEELDDTVGRVLATLDRLKLADNTLVVFSSDNGATPWVGYDYRSRASLNGHSVNGILRGEKGTGWEGGTRVPLIVRWPGHAAAGKTSQALVSMMDLKVSFARLLGVTLPAGDAGDGVDVLQALLGQTMTGRHELVEHLRGANCALRVDNWKFINGQLYDLSSDLSETRNLAGDYPDRAAAMASRLKELRGGTQSGK